MKYPLIPIKQIVDAIPGDLPKMNAMNMLDIDQLYSWAVAAIRKIKVSAHFPATSYIRIKDNNAKLPHGFKLCRYVTLVGLDDVFARTTINFTQEQYAAVCLPMGILRPSDSTDNMNLHVGMQAIPGVPVNNMSYLLRVPPGIIRTSFKCGVVQMNFNRLPVDEEGNICMLDEESHVEAVDKYCRIKLLEENYMMGKLSQNIWDDYNGRFEDALTDARNAVYELSEEEMHYMILQQNKRYSMFNLL